MYVMYSGCTHTLNSVVLVDLLGVANIARCLALHAVFVSFSLLTGSPFMGTLSAIWFRLFIDRDDLDLIMYTTSPDCWLHCYM